MSPRHTDAKPGWILREFAAIRKQMREDRAARRLESAAIGKGGITIRNRGTLRTKYAAGPDALILGPVYPDARDEGAQIALLDEAGQVIFNAYRLPVTAANPVAASAVYMQGDFCYMLSKNYLGQVYVDDTKVQIFGGTGGVQIGHSTTGASANCFIDPSDSRIWRSTSSRRYKQDIEDAEVDTAEVLALRPRTWRDKGEVERDPETTTRYVGLIAEEVDEHPSLAQFVTRKDGEPEAVDYDRLSTVALLAVVKDLAARVEALESADEGPAES